MSVVSRGERARSRAERLVADEYERRKGEVLGTVTAKLAASGVRTADLDLDACYNDAWHALYVKLQEGEEVESRTGLLVTIAYRRALDEVRALQARPALGEEALEGAGVEPDVAGRLDDARRLRLLVEGMRERLDGRERKAAALCWLYDYTRPEAARALGVTPKRMEKIMDGVSQRLRELVGEIESGDRCAGHASLMRAYAIGLLEAGGERHRLARDHLDDCSACRRRVLAMRGIAAVAPPVPIVLLALEGLAGAAGAGAGVAGAAGHGAGAASGAGSGAAASAGAGSGAAAGGGGAVAGAGAGAAAGGGAAGLGALGQSLAQQLAAAPLLGEIGAKTVAIGGTAAALAVAAWVGLPDREADKRPPRTANPPAQVGSAAPAPAAAQQPAAPQGTTPASDAARRAAARRRAAERRARERERREAAARRTTTVSTPAPDPDPTPAPAQQPVEPAPTPAPAAQPPARDGAEEFELR